MIAVVMAGGEGTRLRPLTSKRPKPLVPIANKPVMEHIVELLKNHGITKQIVTLYFLPDSIKNYFGDGTNLGVELYYKTEDSPLGTAGSVKNAQEALNDTFIVISGDALTDLDITKALEYHKQKKSKATLVLKRVENPLDFGIVITDEKGRIERFLEKPGWGQVFSDTINTGIYILEPEVLDYIPKNIPFDFSKDLFPLILEKGISMYGYIADCYWCDVGNIEQFMTAQIDVLKGNVDVNINGIEMGENIWIGSGASIDPEAVLKGPLIIGENSKIDANALIDEYSVIGDNVIIGSDSQVTRSVIMDNCYIGNSAKIQSALISERCDIKSNAIIEEGAVIGDECYIGENAAINHHVKIYPFKIIDAGAIVSSDIIWESRGVQTLFGSDGITGLVNVDITPEMAVRLGMALGSTLPKGAHIICSRDASRASRIIKRAILSGVNSTGVHCRDLQVASASLNRFTVSTSRSLGGFHVRAHPQDSQSVQISFFDAAGVDIDGSVQREIEKHFFRGEYRRAFFGEIGKILYQSRTREVYTNEMLRLLDTSSISERRFKIAIDYAFGVTSMMMPSLLGELNCNVIAVNPYTSEDKPSLTHDEFEASILNLSTAIKTFKADIGFLFDSGGERMCIIDEKGKLIDGQLALLLMISLVCKTSPKKGQVAVPLNVTKGAEQVAASCGVKVLRTKASNAALMNSALKRDVIFAGDADGGYIFPRFISAFDAIMNLGKILEMLAHIDKPVSELVSELPKALVERFEVYCPWEHKGLVMRKIAEKVKDKEVILVDGVKFMEDGQWTLVLPAQDKPLVHIFAEGKSKNSSENRIKTTSDMVTKIIRGA